jgi:hypothetical protein
MREFFFCWKAAAAAGVKIFDRPGLCNGEQPNNFTMMHLRRRWWVRWWWRSQKKCLRHARNEFDKVAGK